MKLAILGMGKSAPPASITQEEAVRIGAVLGRQSADAVKRLSRIYSQTGIERRHIALGATLINDLLDGTRHSESVFLPLQGLESAGPTTGQRMKLYAELAAPLAADAARHALHEARWHPEDVTHIVTVSCTGFCAPGVDFALIDQLRLPPTVQRTHVGFMGCHGALNGLRVASAFAGANPAARVLLCAVEIASLHYQYGSNPQHLIPNALFGDVRRHGRTRLSGTVYDGWSVAATGSCLFPNSADAMTWSIGDHGFEMALSKQTPDLIARNLRPWLTQWLDECGLCLDDIKSWAVHPGGPRILTAVEEALNLKPEQTNVSREVLSSFGNMSSPTVLFIVERLRSRSAPRPALALAFGPGLVAEAALFD